MPEPLSNDALVDERRPRRRRRRIWPWVLGFFLILIVTGAIIVGMARVFWRGRHDITLLVVGAVQALLGVMVYLGRHNV